MVALTNILRTVNPDSLGDGYLNLEGGPTLLKTAIPTAQPTSIQNIPSIQMNALHDLYDSTGGRYWRWRREREVSIENHYAIWNFSGYHNPCSEKWQGLLCSCESSGYISVRNSSFSPISFTTSSNSTNCSVSALVLVAFNMTGILPQSIGNLTSLHLLSLSINRIHGRIPSSIGNCSYLQVFELSFNNFTGYIPTELFTLSNLEYLSLERLLAL